MVARTFWPSLIPFIFMWHVNFYKQSIEWMKMYIFCSASCTCFLYIRLNFKPLSLRDVFIQKCLTGSRKIWNNSASKYLFAESFWCRFNAENFYFQQRQKSQFVIFDPIYIILVCLYTYINVLIPHTYFMKKKISEEKFTFK